MAKRPIIGIPCMAVPAEWYGLTSGNYVSYLRAIEAAGGIPALIHLTNDQEVLRVHFERCDGLLFAGGDDIDPQQYGEPRHPRLGATSPAQDRLELTLAGWARAAGLPLLGICRGHQLLNVAFGGTLYQDIASQLPDALDHRASDRQRQWSLLAHPLTLAPDAWLAERLDADMLPANTLHHQAVKQLAPGLRAVGWAPDGLVEALEGTGSQLVLGVQCHPEELWERAEPRWARLFAGFVGECVRRR